MAETPEQLKSERDEARAGYHQLDKNWNALHDASMGAIRTALGMPDASVPEMCQQIKALQRAAGVLQMM